MKRLLFFFSALLALLCLAPTLSLAQQSNISGTVMPSASQTALTVNSQDMPNTNAKGGHVNINVSAYVSGNYTPHIQGKDPTSGVYYDILIATGSNIISAIGMYNFKVYPGIGTVAGGAASDIIPPTWRVQLIGASTPSMTLSVGYAFDN